MSKRGNSYGSETRVNILKKVKVGANWNLYPAVVEPNGKLRDKVRVRGEVELHPEGYFGRGHFMVHSFSTGATLERIC